MWISCIRGGSRPPSGVSRSRDRPGSHARQARPASLSTGCQKNGRAGRSLRRHRGCRGRHRRSPSRRNDRHRPDQHQAMTAAAWRRPIAASFPCANSSPQRIARLDHRHVVLKAGGLRRGSCRALCFPPIACLKARQEPRRSPFEACFSTDNVRRAIASGKTHLVRPSGSAGFFAKIDVEIVVHAHAIRLRLRVAIDLQQVRARAAAIRG